MEPIISSSILIAIACAIATACIPFLKWVAFLFHLTDNPNADSLKIHTRPIPFLGGCALLLACAAPIGLLTSGILPRSVEMPWAPPYLVGILCAMGVVWLFGLWDDLKWQTRSGGALLQKILSQLLMAVCVSTILAFADLTPIIELDELTVCILSGVALLVIVNASNLHDGLDGLLSGLSLISAFGFLIFFLTTNHGLGALISALCVGSLIGFLIFNAPPASIFLGDNGSYLIGCLVTILSLLAVNTASLSSIFGTLLIIGMPLINLGYVIARRLCARRSPMTADRSHLYDRIHRATGSVRKTLLIHLAMQCLLVAGGIVLSVRVYG